MGEKSTKELLQELEDMPLTKFTRKYGHLTLGGIYEKLESDEAQILALTAKVEKLEKVVEAVRGAFGVSDWRPRELTEALAALDEKAEEEGG